jgi:hypothetical protein
MCGWLQAGRVREKYIAMNEMQKAKGQTRKHSEGHHEVSGRGVLSDASSMHE